MVRKLEYVRGDITSVTRGIVAHGVNCRGVMGSGIAKAIRMKWPQAYATYLGHYKEFDDKNKMLGSVSHIFINPELVIMNCATQLNFGNDGKQYANPDAIRKSLLVAFTYADIYELPMYLPKIGCGLGGLTWERDVEPIVGSLARHISMPVRIMELL